MMKKALITTLLLAVLAAALLGCGAPAQESATPPPQESKTLRITVTNASDYVFNELYITPTSQSDWGQDHLGSTSILKKNGSFDVTLAKYDFENYDIRIVDQDEDVYLFKYVPLNEGSKVAISFGDGLIAEVTGADGSSQTVGGELVSGSGDDSGGDYDYTMEDFAFNIYNESEYSIYAVYMYPAYTDGDGVDVLPTVLESGDSQYVTGSVVGTDYEGITEWVLHVVDVDGDASISYDVFDPWNISYVDVTWDSSVGGYVCDFVE